MAMMGPGSGPPTIHWWLGRRKSADSGPATSGVVQGIAINPFHRPDRVSFASLDPSGPLGHLHTPVYTAVQMIAVLVIAQLALFAITALLGTLRNITQQLLQNEVSMRIQLM